MARGTWQTTSSSSSALPVALAIGAVVLAVAVAGPVLAAVAELARLVVVIVITIAAVAALAGAALVAYRLRHSSAPRALPEHRARVLPQRAAEPLQEPRRPAIEAPKQELHIHHHWHGVTAEEIAAIISQQRGE